MLANGVGVNCNTGVSTTICSWTADGLKKFVGCFISSQYGGYARLYVGGVEKWRLDLPYPGCPATEIVDQPVIPNPGIVYELKFYHENGVAVPASGAILGN